MNSEIKKMLEKLNNIHFFSNCGALSTVYSVVQDWNTAIDVLNSMETQNNLVNVKNHLVEKIPDKVFNKWNVVSSEVKEQVSSIIFQKNFVDCLSRNVPDSHRDRVKDKFQFDIVLYIMRLHYKNYIETARYFDLSYLAYCEGRFSCGWLGEYPQGVIIVF